MSGTGSYHEHPQPFRIQKRLVLNQCFRSVYAQWQDGTTINYVTFGGEHLYDVMDLVAVFDICHQAVNVVSYEENEGVAIYSRTCPVAATLSKVTTVSIEIVPTVFFENARPLHSIRNRGPLIYFLDDTKTFRERQAATLLELLEAKLILPGDWLLITSCLTPRVLHQTRFMSQYIGSFQTFFGARTNVSVDFRVRNHVDLHVARCFSTYQPIELNTGTQFAATLVRKFRYRDTKAPMGLWLYRIEERKGSGGLLTDTEFEVFPHAFEFTPVEPDVPNIFDD